LALAGGRRGDAVGCATTEEEGLMFGVDGRVGVDGGVTGVGAEAGGAVAVHSRPCCTASDVKA